MDLSLSLSRSLSACLDRRRAPPQQSPCYAYEPGQPQQQVQLNLLSWLAQSQPGQHCAQLTQFKRYDGLLRYAEECVHDTAFLLEEPIPTVQIYTSLSLWKEKDSKMASETGSPTARGTAARQAYRRFDWQQDKQSNRMREGKMERKTWGRTVTVRQGHRERETGRTTGS